MITSSQIEHWLPRVARYGERLARQGEAIFTLSENASAEVVSILGPAVVLGLAVAKAHQTIFAWILDDSSLETFPLTLQARIAQQADAWHVLRAALGRIAFTRRLPNLRAIEGQTGISLEEILATATGAGVSFADFWSVSLYGQASLERLIRSDFTLTRAVDFDPLAEEAVVLSDVVPRIPDVPTMLTAIRDARTVPYADLVVAEGLAVAVQGGDTLATVAGRHLGDSNQWRALAELNGLRSPYISESAVDQLGAVVSQKTLTTATLIGTSFAVLANINGLYRDQRIRFVSGANDETMTVISLVPATSTVQFAESFTLAFNTASVVTVYNPTYDVRGRVLRPGDILVLPGSTGLRSRTVVQRNSVGNPALVYGTDIILQHGDLVATNGDLALVSGTDNLVQALRHRFQVERGQLSFHPNYGSGLKQHLAWKAKPFFTFLTEIEAQQTAIRDPRIAAIEHFESTVEGDLMSMTMMVRTHAHEQFPVPRFFLDVRANG